MFLPFYRTINEMYLFLLLACSTSRYTYKDVQELFNNKYSKTEMKFFNY